MAMKRPLPLRASSPQACLASRNGLVSSSAISASQRSSGNSATGATCWKPALAITASRRPKRSSAASTAARLPSRPTRSAAYGVPGPSSSGSRSTASTSAPSAASPAASARPIPLAAPVTIALRAMARVLVERDRHRHAVLRLALRDRVPGPLTPAQAQPHRRALSAQVAPPHLALGPADADLHRLALLAVGDREGEDPAAAPAGDADERQAAAGGAVQRRAQQQPDRRIADAVEDAERGVTFGHGPQR